MLVLQLHEANEKLKELYRKYKENRHSRVLSFFCCKKSGTLSVSQNQWVIEAVEGDLWHLVDESKVDVTMVKNHNKSWQFTGQSSFLTDLEIKELEKHISMVLLTFRKLIKGW